MIESIAQHELDARAVDLVGVEPLSVHAARGEPAPHGRPTASELLAAVQEFLTDQVMPDWDMTGYAEDAKLLFAVGYRVAQADKFPEWKAGNEFKAIREKGKK